MLLAVPAYLCFRGRTQTNILNNFRADLLSINLARLLLSLALLLGYPLECFVAQRAITQFSTGEGKPHRAASSLVTCVIVTVTAAVTLSSADLEGVLEVTGGVAASALAFIFPAACDLQLNTHCRRTRLPSQIMLVLGMILLVASAAGRWTAGK